MIGGNIGRRGFSIDILLVWVVNDCWVDIDLFITFKLSILYGKWLMSIFFILNKIFEWKDKKDKLLSEKISISKVMIYSWRQLNFIKSRYVQYIISIQCFSILSIKFMHIININHILHKIMQNIAELSVLQAYSTVPARLLSSTPSTQSSPSSPHFCSSPSNTPQISF